MENRIELFDRYIDGALSASEKQQFAQRLKSDADFATDFNAYLMVVRGIRQEAQQDNYEFGHAMKGLSRTELLRIIGRDHRQVAAPRSFGAAIGERLARSFREQTGWVASMAAILVVGFFAIGQINRSANNRIDDLVVAYNNLPDYDRFDGKILYDMYPGGEGNKIPDEKQRLTMILPTLKERYFNPPSDNIQTQQDDGMRLAMAYLQLHERKQACEILEDMKKRFADDEIFVAQIDRILEQIQ